MGKNPTPIIFLLLSLSLAHAQVSEVQTFYQSPDYTLDLGGQRFDPLQRTPQIPDHLQAAVSEGSDLFLIQYQGPTQDQWLADLGRSQVKIVQYIHPFTYIVWSDAEQLADATRSRNVRWAGRFEPAYRLLPRWQNLNGEKLEVIVLAYRGADTAEIRDSLRALGGEGLGARIIDQRFEAISLTIEGNRLNEIARIPGVYTVQPVPTDGGARGELSNQIVANNMSPDLVPFVGYQAWLTQIGLTGVGVIAANVDGGVDENHPDLIGQFLPCVGTSCGGSTVDSHGTHTAGIMGATGASGTVDANGFLRGLGVAPGAKMVEQRYSGIFTQPGGMLLLMTESSQNNATISGNSWGPAGSPRGYDNDTMQVDIGARDADPNTAGNQPFTYVLSIMNGGGGFQSQGTPDEAKNIFTIGSTWAQFSDGSPRPNLNSISDNSAHGPALDTRFIPHMLAPGKAVDSTTPSSTYDFKSGTSMASPHVTGGVMLFFEFYRNLPSNPGGEDPSPALVKASFMPVAVDLEGNTDADGGTLGHRIDSKQGWGRMDLEAVLDPDVQVLYFDNPQIFDNTGESWSETLGVGDPTKPVKMMLAWTDAPGHGLGGTTPAWNNDLDLEVNYNSNTYVGNNIGPDGWSAIGGTHDAMNNTEGVLLGPTTSGTFTVTVNATNITSDGIANMGDLTDQDFAFVCYNCVLEPTFTLESDANNLQACEPDDAVFQLTIDSLLGFDESVTFSVDGLNGLTANFSENPVTPPGTTTLTIGNTDGVAPGVYQLTVQAVTASQNRSLPLEVEVLSEVTTLTTLQNPANGGADVSIAPTLNWDTVDGASSYVVQLSTDPTFSADVLEATVSTNSLESNWTLAAMTTYYWRVSSFNDCGPGAGFTGAFSFTTGLATILLIDDDNNAPDVRASYITVLDALGLPYEVWDTNNSNMEPELSFMRGHQPIIWFSGAATGNPKSGPNANSEIDLAAYLNGGGCLILSAQDYLDDMGSTSFMTDFMGLASGTTNAVHETISGQGSFTGMGPYTLTPLFKNNSDGVTEDGGAELLFNSSQGGAAVGRTGANFKTAWMAFPLEFLTEADMTEVMEALLEWCGLQLGCDEMADLTDKYTDWGVSEDITTLIDCLNSIEPL